MATITSDLIERAYFVARRVVSGEITEREGVDDLVKSEMNRASAGDYVRCLRYLLLGKEFKRTVSVEGARIFLKNILRDYGEAGYQNALLAFKLHVDYYDSLGQGRVRSLRALIEKFSDQVFQTFDEAVQGLKGESMSALVQGALQIGDFPAVRSQTVVAFVRNPFVAAARLKLANGQCEGCFQPAPFLRSNNGEPYLEVHHKVRLADGGPDILENTLALCPNCHRKAHYG